jgi:hypothetical protein
MNFHIHQINPWLEKATRSERFARASHFFYWTLFLAFFALLMGYALGASPATGEPETTPSPTQAKETPVAAIPSPTKSPVVGTEGYLARVTWFSSHECGTTFCRANAGKPRGHKAALNFAKYGRHSKVYVATWDVTYDVIGSTDSKTDLDIWCEGDEACQEQVGSRTLRINLID